MELKLKMVKFECKVDLIKVSSTMHTKDEHMRCGDSKANTNNFDEIRGLNLNQMLDTNSNVKASYLECAGSMYVTQTFV